MNESLTSVDVDIVGSGPNGLAAAVTLARAGMRVRVYERDELAGGGMRTESLGVRGTLHDLCSAVHPQALNSEFFRKFEIERRVNFITPEVSFGHAFLDRPSALIYQDFQRTVQELGDMPGKKYARRLGLAHRFLRNLGDATLGGPAALIRHPISAALLGTTGMVMAWEQTDDPVDAVFAGLKAHGGRQDSLAAGIVAAALGVSAHQNGWPIPVGGSGSIATAMLDDLKAHGGLVQTGVEIEHIDQMDAPYKVLNVQAKQAAALLRGSVSAEYESKLLSYRQGYAVIKIDFVLTEPVPWSDSRLRAVPTLHIGGSAGEARYHEASVLHNGVSNTPLMIAAQPTVVDPSRSDQGWHTFWLYCHVPYGIGKSYAQTMIHRVEQFAPGFMDVIVDQFVTTPKMFEEHNPNYVRGDILGGEVNIKQLIARPVSGLKPWRTGHPRVWLASASVAPGPSVHGMSGYLAALDILHQASGRVLTPDLSLIKL